MDQKKIGAFIARRRKELDMTQNRKNWQRNWGSRTVRYRNGKRGVLCRICLCCSLSAVY